MPKISNLIKKITPKFLNLWIAIWFFAKIVCNYTLPQPLRALKRFEFFAKFQQKIHAKVVNLWIASLCSQ